MCTKNFNYERLIGEQLEAKRGIDPDDIGKMDVLQGNMLVYDRDGEGYVGRALDDRPKR